MHRIKQKEAKARPESAGQGRARQGRAGQGRAGRGQDKVGRGRVGQGGAGWSQGELRPALASPDMSLKTLISLFLSILFPFLALHLSLLCFDY